MSDCKIYPADTVDIYGNVWPTDGENIRNGIFGKLKIAKINIDGLNITSSDLEITEIGDYYFSVNEKVVLLFIDKVYKGLVSLRMSYFPTYCSINSTSHLEKLKADITILYTE